MLTDTVIQSPTTPPSSHKVAMLRLRHKELEQQLSMTPAYLSDRRASLKRQKLKIKDEMVQIGAI